MSNYDDDEVKESYSSPLESDLDSETLLFQKQDLLEFLQNLHYRFSEDEAVDSFELSQIIRSITETLERYDSL